jgi:ATP-binding cassette subfamily B protein
MTKVANDITYQMRKDVRAKIDRLPLKYFDSHNYGDVLSHITNDIDTINQSLTQGITSLITSMASILGIGVMMFSISWQMALVAMLVLPLSSFLIRAIMKKSQQYFKEQQKTIGRLNGQVEEMYGNHLIVKAFNGEEQAVASFTKDNEVLYGTNWKSQFFSGIMQPIMMFIGNFGYVLIAVLGGFFAATGRILLGDLQAFIQYMRQFTQPIGQIAAQSNAFQSAIAGAEKVFALLEEMEEEPDPADARQREDVASKVSFDHIKFGYEPETPVIKNFSFDVQPGQKVAIVGPTGAGKTTIVKLLMRFYDVQEGSILVDGTKIQSFKRNDLRSLFGMVLQDTWLYNGTIRDNIRYGQLDASDEMVESAAQTAQVDHFVKTLPDGYETILNEESSNISAGQKQLLTIARAILANPKMLILDEATSSVDTRMEILIQKAMDRLMEGRTSFIIAHRLSTIKNADRILVMDKGDIVEIGTHEELLSKGGFYAMLYNAQFEHLEPMVSQA